MKVNGLTIDAGNNISEQGIIGYNANALTFLHQKPDCSDTRLLPVPTLTWCEICLRIE